MIIYFVEHSSLFFAQNFTQLSFRLSVTFSMHCHYQNVSENLKDICSSIGRLLEFFLLTQHVSSGGAVVVV